MKYYGILDLLQKYPVEGVTCVDEMRGLCINNC